MSLIVSITHPEAIIMASDTKIITRITSEEYNQSNNIKMVSRGTESSEQRKTFEISNIGCLSFWGETTRTLTEINQFKEKFIKADDDIVSFSQKFYDFLKIDIKPDTDIGFHLGGYDRTGIRKLYHIFYGVQEGEEDKGIGFYKNEEDTGVINKYKILYNGKPQYTHEAIILLKELESRGYLVSPAEHTIEDNKNLAVSLINHTARIISRYDSIQSVGGHINVFIIYPGNRIIKECYPCTGEKEGFSKGSGDSINSGIGIWQ